MLLETNGERWGSCASIGAIKVEKVGESVRISPLLTVDRGEEASMDMAYLL